MLAYVFACTMCELYSVFLLGNEFLPDSFFWRVLSFDAAPYSWYVEMYIGLFLLIPFLSAMWDALNKEQRKVLIITVVIVLFLPNFINTFDWKTSGWWMNPQTSNSMQQILPAWWVRAYPIGYYFAGRWIREYGLNLSKPKAICLYAGLAYFLAAFDWWRSHGSTFVWASWNDYNSPIILAEAVLLFWFVMTLRICPPQLSRIMSFISRVSFGAYLSSWVWDQAFYRVLNETVSPMPLRLNWFPVVVGGVFLCSLASSWIIERCVHLSMRCASMLFSEAR